MNTRILLLMVFACGIMFGSCRKKIQGCTDPAATNYNSSATEQATCLYPIDDAIGTYAACDTYIVFKTNWTSWGYYDTTISNFDIHASKRADGSVNFDTVIVLYNPYQQSAVVSADYKSYSFSYLTYSITANGTARINGDVLTYSVAAYPVTLSGSFIRMGRAIKKDQ